MLDSEKEVDLFRRWLEANTSLKADSIQDTISRARRAAKFVDIVKAHDVARVNSQLDTSLASSSTFIRSQVKLAAARYIQFKHEEKSIR